MIRVSLSGRIGNALNQYVFARLLSHKNGMYLDTEFKYNHILDTTPHEKGNKYIEPKINIDNNKYSCREIYDMKLPDGLIHLSGYFLDPIIFNNNVDLIRNFFVIPNFDINFKDIVIHIRLGDYYKFGIIDPNWYLGILRNEEFDNLYILGSLDNETYLDNFRCFNPIIIPPEDARNDFLTMMKFNKVICSNSSFCWWAVFLGNAKIYYTISRWTSWNYNGEINSSFLKNATRIDGDLIKYNPITFYGDP